MHGTEINPFVPQVLGDRVDADMGPSQMALGVLHLNGAAIDHQIDILG